MSTIITLALVLGGLGLLLVVAELGARWWIRHRSGWYVWPPGLRVRLHLDPEVFPDLESDVTIEINARGERGGPPLPAGRPGYRVLVCGGSAAECYNLDGRTSWPGAVQELLAAPGNLRRLGAPAVHVGNIARSRLGSEALDVILERVLPRYQDLDAIVIMVGASDVLGWLARSAPADFERLAPKPETCFWYHPFRERSWRPSGLALNELVRRWRRRWLRPWDEKHDVGKSLRKVREMRARAREIRTEVPDPTPVMDNFERHFRAIVERARRHARRVLVVLQPCMDKAHSPEEAARFWNAAAGNPFAQDIEAYYDFAVVGRLMGLMNARAAKVATEAGVDHLDLMPHLERSLRTYYDYFHFTPEGAGRIAELVAAKLLGEPLPRPLPAEALVPGSGSVAS